MSGIQETMCWIPGEKMSKSQNYAKFRLENIQIKYWSDALSLGDSTFHCLIFEQKHE